MLKVVAVAERVPRNLYKQVAHPHAGGGGGHARVDVRHDVAAVAARRADCEAKPVARQARAAWGGRRGEGGVGRWRGEGGGGCAAGEAASLG